MNIQIYLYQENDTNEYPTIYIYQENDTNVMQMNINIEKDTNIGIFKYQISARVCFDMNEYPNIRIYSYQETI